MDYGATGDGTTNDTAAIHAARDAAGQGGQVVIPAGTYVVSGLTASVADQTWELAGTRRTSSDVDPGKPAAIARITTEAGAASILHVTAQGVNITGGLFDGSAGTAHDWSQQGILIEADGVTVRDSEIRDSPRHGVYALNCDRITIAGCVILNHYDGGVFIQNSRSETARYDMVVTGNHIESSRDTAHGIGVLGGTSVNTTNMPIYRVTVDQNTVVLPFNPITESSCLGITNCTDWTATRNVLQGSFLSISCPNATRARILSNQVRGFSLMGIEIPRDVTDCLVGDNVIDAAGIPTEVGSGIQNSLGRIKNLSIVGNTIFGFTNGMTGIGFSVGSEVESASVTRNVIRASGQVYKAVQVADKAENLTISENTFDAGTSEIAIVVDLTNIASNTAIANNLFTATSSSANRSIVFGGSSARNLGVAVTGNTFKPGPSGTFAVLEVYSQTSDLLFAGNSVDGAGSKVADAINLFNAVDGLTVRGNKFSNLQGSIVRLQSSAAVTMKTIKMSENSVVNVQNQIYDVSSGQDIVEPSVMAPGR